MKRTPYLHNSSFIRLLALLSQLNVLFTSTSAAATRSIRSAQTTTEANFNVNSAKTIRTSEKEWIISSSPPEIFSPFTKSSVNQITSKGPTINRGNVKGVATPPFDSGNIKIVIPENSSTTTLAMNDNKSANKYALDLQYSKNHWPSTDLVNHGASSPLTSAATTGAEKSRIFRNKHHHEHHWGPFFEESLNSTTAGENLISTAHLFTEAVLNCRVGMLKDKTVMWVRRTSEKVSLLTVGNITYSGDPRIRVKFQYPNNWRLLINPTRREDDGIYMCQVSTYPPRVFTTNLTILEPPLRLIDDQEREVSDRYYKSGSTIELQCQVSRSFVYKENLSILKSIQPFSQNQSKTLQKTLVGNITHNNFNLTPRKTPKQNQGSEYQLNNFIFWAKDYEPIPATVVQRSSATEKWFVSRLSIPDAKISDSGNYSCSIGKLFTAIVQVQVLTGELPAAVQHNSASISNHKLHPFLLQSCWIYLIVAFTVVSRNISPCYRSSYATLLTDNWNLN